MEKKDESKKCYCSRCFQHILGDDLIEIEGSNYHKGCSMCCICQKIPTSLKMFYGHVFCTECFNQNVLTRIRNGSNVHCNAWWTHWPGTEKVDQPDNKDEPEQSSSKGDVPRKMCSRCFRCVCKESKVDIDGLSYHKECCQCSCCGKIPTTCLKIYYGHVFCEECFHKSIVPRNKENEEFFKSCLGMWDASPRFAHRMAEFMAPSGARPFVCVAPGGPRKCELGTCVVLNKLTKTIFTAATPTVSIAEVPLQTWDLTDDRSMTGCTIAEPVGLAAATVEKIEKLSKHLEQRADESWGVPPSEGWVKLRGKCAKRTSASCPKCLWQCGVIYVDDEKFKVAT